MIIIIILIIYQILYLHFCFLLIPFAALLTIMQVHQLPPEKLKQREVVHIDIANDPVTPADYKPDEDPTK